MRSVIKYHILSLLCLAIAAITGIEAAAQFMHPTKGMANPLGWLMVLVCIGSVALYYRARKFRKKASGF